MSFKIKVPYSEKDHAKSKGAFWDNQYKTWYVPDNKDLNDFLNWIDTKHINIIAKAPFYVGINHCGCWKCHSKTKVIALYSDNFFCLESEDEGKIFFEKADSKSFFNMVTYLDQDIAAFLSSKFPFFKLGFSKTVGESYWANHCIQCGALQGDFFNHNEPGGAFFPISEEECSSITLVKLPFSYDAGLQGCFSYSSDEDDVFQFAKRMEWQ